MPLLAPLVDWAKAARAAVGTWGYAGPNGLGCTDLATHPDTQMAIPSGTTIARIHLTRPLLAADKPPCALTDWLQGDNPDVPILQVRLHADDVDDVIQAFTGRANPTVNKTQRRRVGTEGTAVLFAAHKPTNKKAVKDKYPFKHPHLDTLRYVVDSKPAMALPNYSLISHSPYCWKPELVGLTTPVLMESEDAFLPLPMCHALPLIGTSEPVNGGHLRASERGALRVGSDGARVQGGVPGKGWRHAGEHEDRGEQRGSEVGRHLQRGMAKPKPATGSTRQACGVRGDSDGQMGVKKVFSFLKLYFGHKQFCKASLRSTRVCSW